AHVTPAMLLVAGNNQQFSAFTASVARSDDASAAPAPGDSVRPQEAPGSAGDLARWDPPEGDDPDAAAWTHPVLRALRVRVVGADDQPAFGIPVRIKGAREGSPVLAGPKFTTSDGRVRFPIDVRMEQQHEILVAARAVPGRAASVPAKVVLDQPTDVVVAIDAGIRGAISVTDPDGRPA